MKLLQYVSLFLVILAPILSLGARAAFDKDLYLNFNPIIVVGSVVDDREGTPFEWLPGRPDWCFPTRCGAVVVHRVLRQFGDSHIAVGDTLRFCYPSGNTAKNDSILTSFLDVCEISQMNGLVVGAKGVYPFRESEKFIYEPGSWFLATQAQQNELLEYFSQLGPE